MEKRTARSRRFPSICAGGSVAAALRVSRRRPSLVRASERRERGKQEDEGERESSGARRPYPYLEAARGDSGTDERAMARQRALCVLGREDKGRRRQIYKKALRVFRNYKEAPRVFKTEPFRNF